MLQEKIDEASEIAKKKSRDEGERIGIAKSIMLMKKNDMSISQIAQIMEMSEAEIEELLAVE